VKAEHDVLKETTQEELYEQFERVESGEGMKLDILDTKDLILVVEKVISTFHWILQQIERTEFCPLCSEMALTLTIDL